MRATTVLVTGLLASALSSPVHAQFSSDIPGVARAATPFAGARQTRVEYDLNFLKNRAGPAGDSLAFGTRLGLGRSWRIQSNWEVGFDLTFFGVAHIRPPDQDDAQDTNELPALTSGLLLYSPRVGVKYRPIVSLTPEGYGYHAAVGIAFQPPIKPVFAATLEGDSTRTGGMFVGGDAPLVGAVPRSLQIALMGSYRSQRLAVDAALQFENSELPVDQPGPSPVAVYDGASLRVGGTYRLTPGFAAGGVYWGNSAPPWRDRIGLPGTSGSESSFGILLSFGAHPEAGRDLILTTPTGSFGESARLYLRTRSTR